MSTIYENLSQVPCNSRLEQPQTSTCYSSSSCWERWQCTAPMPVAYRWRVIYHRWFGSPWSVADSALKQIGSCPERTEANRKAQETVMRWCITPLKTAGCLRRKADRPKLMTYNGDTFRWTTNIAVVVVASILRYALREASLNSICKTCCY